MALYLSDGKKYKININGVAYCLNIVPVAADEIIAKLMSFDNHLLRDSAGIFLTCEESD